MKRRRKPRPEWVEEIIHGVPEGMRHWSAVRLVGRWYGKGMDFDQVCRDLIKWNKRNMPPMEPEEMKSILLSTVKWEKEEAYSRRLFRGL